MYDAGVGMLTLGRADTVRRYIAENFVGRGDRVLEIGCGTGRLAVLCAKAGAQVTAIDVSPKMIARAKERVKHSGIKKRIELRRMNAVDMDKEFQAHVFDIVIGVFVMGDLTEAEGDFVLKQCRRVLKPRRRLILAERVAPKSVLRRLFLKIVGIPLAFAAAVLAPASLYPVRNLEEKLSKGKFLVVEVKDILLGGIRIYVSERVGR